MGFIIRDPVWQSEQSPRHIRLELPLDSLRESAYNTARNELPKWRNWQTRYVQGVVPLLECGFDSHLRHNEKQDCYITYSFARSAKLFLLSGIPLFVFPGVLIPLPSGPSRRLPQEALELLRHRKNS